MVIREFPLSVIFTANLALIDNTLLQTEDFTEHLILDVNQVFIRELLGKYYKVTINEVLTDFEDVYTGFDIAEFRGIAHAPLTHFRYNLTVRFKEDCNSVVLDRCEAIKQNVPMSERLSCIMPTFDFSDPTVQNSLTPQQIADLTAWLI